MVPLLALEMRKANFESDAAAGCSQPQGISLKQRVMVVSDSLHFMHQLLRCVPPHQLGDVLPGDGAPPADDSQSDDHTPHD